MRTLILFGLCCFIGHTTIAQNLLTLKGDTLNISQEKNKVLYVLLCDKSCTGCIKFLGECIKKAKPRISIVIITAIPNGDFIYKKEYVASIKKKFPEKVQFLTDINNGLFEKYRIKQTPSMLFYEKGSFEQIPYELIFDDVFVKASMEKRIRQYVRRK